MTIKKEKISEMTVKTISFVSIDFNGNVLEEFIEFKVTIAIGINTKVK